MAALNTPTDALPLLAYKIAPRQFDVSYRLANISLRDQIVRAQLLVRTLLTMMLVTARGHETGNEFQLLICGAGAAGLAAAKEADAHGISFVLIEKDVGAPGGVLRSTAERYVSTAMYEWPHPNHIEHQFPLGSPELLGGDKLPMPTMPLNLTKPVLVSDFGKVLGGVLQSDLATWKQNFHDFTHGKLYRHRSLFVEQTVLDDTTKGALRAMLDAKVSIHGVPLSSQELPFVKFKHFSEGCVSNNFHFQYVIYAVGFAKEVVEYAEKKEPYHGYQHTSFWEPDLVTQPNLGFMGPPCVGILGSGDGALQDALRCLICPNVLHPLDVWDHLMKYPGTGTKTLLESPYIRIAMAEVAAADGYTTAGAVWSHETHIFKSLDAAFRDIVGRLLVHEGMELLGAVNSLVRNDVKKVTVINRHGYFSKAYALNRFLVLLLEEVLKTPGQPHTGKLEIMSGTVTKFMQNSPNVRGASLEVEDASADIQRRDCELAIIRGGLDRNASPSQLVGLSGVDTGRAELGRIPPPIRPIGWR